MFKTHCWWYDKLKKRQAKIMLRTGDQYRNSLRDGREVWINGKKVEDVPNHPVFKPIVDIRARIYDMAHEEKFSDKLTYTDEKTEEKNCVGSKLPKSKNDWLIKREAMIPAQ